MEELTENLYVGPMLRRAVCVEFMRMLFGRSHNRMHEVH